MNAAADVRELAKENGFSETEAMSAAGAAGLISYFGAKLLPKAGALGNSLKNPAAKFVAGAASVGNTMGVQGAAMQGVQNLATRQPFTQGMGDAYAEGQTEGVFFHTVNGLPGALMEVPGYRRAKAATKAEKAFVKEAMLDAAENRDGAALLNALMDGEGLRAAEQAVREGKPVTRSLAKRAGIPDNMSVEERTRIVSAVMDARRDTAGERARAEEIRSRDPLANESERLRAKAASEREAAERAEAERVAREREITARRQAEIAEQKRQAEEFDRAERERAERERMEAENAPTMNEERRRDYHAWLRKQGRKNTDKNFRAWVKREGVEHVTAEDAEFIRGRGAVGGERTERQTKDAAKRNSETVAALQRMADETSSRFADERGREAWERRADLDRRAEERARAEEESLLANEEARAAFERRAQRQEDLEAAFRDYGERLDAEATPQGEAAKPAETAQDGGSRERLANMSRAAQMRHYEVSRLTGADFNEANLSAKELEQFKSLYRDYAKGGSAAEHDAATDALKAFVNAHGEAVVPSAQKPTEPAPAAPPLADRQGNPIDKSGKRLPTAQQAKPARAGAETAAKPTEAKPAARRGATPEQLADFRAKIAEAEKLAKEAKVYGAKFSVSVGTTSITFNATDEGIAAAKKLMGKLGRPTNWNRQPASERVPSAPKPTKVENTPADAGEVLKGFVETNGAHPKLGIDHTLTRNGYEYATDGISAVRAKAKPGAKDGGNAETAGLVEGFFKGKAKAGTEARATTAELETALAQAMSVKGGRTKGDKKGSTDYDNDLVEVWRTKDGRLAIRSRSSKESNGDLRNVDPPEPNGTGANARSDAAFFSGETLDGASLLGFASGNRLAKICKAFAKRGDGEISVELDDGGAGMFRFRGKNLEAVLMSKRGGEAEDLSGYEAASKRNGPLYSLGDPRDGGGEAQGTPRPTARVRVNPNLRADVARAMNTDAAKGAVARSRTIVELSDTPDALHALGMPNAKILTNADILRKVNVKHHISADDFAEIPEAYADPVAVFRNGADYIVLTAKKARTAESGEKPVMVYLKPGAKRNTFLASAYAREGGKEDAYVNWAKKGDLLFLDEKKAALVGLKDETLSQLRPLAKSDLSPRSIAKTGEGAQGGQRLFSVANLYTGSAADYEKPSLHAVGTGEGSQVYGWGLYASTERGVAEKYAQKGNVETKINGKSVDLDSISARETPSGVIADTAWGLSSKGYNASRDALIQTIRVELNSLAQRAQGKSQRDGAHIAELANRYRDALRILEDKSNSIEVLPKGNVYEQTFFTDRAPGDESRLLNWYEPVREENLNRILHEAEREGLNSKARFGLNPLLSHYGFLEYQKNNDFKGALLAKGNANSDIYEQLVRICGGAQAASEFLARAGIDGVKYPVDSYGKTLKDGDKAGWNYVSFRDDNITVDHKWRDGERLFSISPKESAEWRDAVDAFAAGKMPSRSDATILPRVPAVMSRVLKDFMGFDADGRSIVASKECLDKVTDGKHNISPEDLKRLPLTLDAPLAVFQSKTRPTDSITALVPIRDANGGISSVAAINYRAQDAQGRGQLRVTSVYGKTSAEAVQEWIDGGLLLYADRKNIARSFSHRLQLPGKNKTAHRFLDENDFSKEAIGIISKTGEGAQGGLSAQSDAAASAADGGRVDMRRLDPQRRSDPKVLEWAKKNGRTVSDGRVTPDAVREYDAQMAQGAAKAVRRWFPDMTVTYHDYGENIKRGQHAIDLRDTAGRALGWFEPRTKDVHLLPGADAATVAHEIMWHGSRDWATARAAAGDRKAQKLVAAMRDVERNAPEDLKRRVNRLYRETGADADTLLNEYGAWLTMGKGGEALEAAMAKAENRAWYAKSLNVVKETVKDYLAAHGKNRVDLSKVDGMGRDEFVKFLAGEFAGGKTLGEIGAKGKVKEVSTKETAFQKARRKVYDINATLRDLQRDIEKKTGRKLTEAEDAEAANALTPGLKEAAVLNVRGKLDGYRSLLKETGISDADAQYYMALKAAAGRDAKVDRRNLAKIDAQAEAAVRAEWGSERIARDEAGFKAAVETRKAEMRSDYESANGSHVSPVEARRMLAELEGGEHAEGYAKIRKYLRGVMDETLDAQVKSGLISEEMAERYRAEEPDYIPFKNEFDAASGDFVGRGAVNLGRPEHFAAKGRRSAAGDITAHIFGDYQATLLRGIETDVRQKLARLVKANPELGTVEKIGEGTRLKEKQKSDRLDPANATGDPNLVLFKQGGDTYAIRLNGERGAAIAAALTERNVRRMDGWFPKFARASAALATRWSPTFSVRNFTKDNIELANIVFAEKGAIEGAKWAGRYMKSQAQMAGTLAKFVTTGKVDATTEQGMLLQKYIDAGGLIGGGATEGYDAKKKSFSPEAIAKELKRGQSKSRAIANHALHSISYLNEFAEMTTRVNAFVAELKGGATEREAALFSRRATVDFNRKGENTGVTNVVRLFSNSTLGATARATSALAKSKAGKVAAAALFANGFAQAMLEYAMNHEEDERRRKSGEATGRDVPEFERKTALFCVRSGDNLYKVAQHESPFSLFNYAGNCAGRVALGQMKLEDMAKNLGVSVAELAYHFTGLGSANLTSRNGDVGDDAKTAIVSGLCPSALQPLAEMLVGTDYKGDKLYRQNFSATTPDSATAKKHTPEYAKTAAAWMNEATGGNEARKGYVDVHPEAVQKLVEGFGKNAARDVMNAYEVGKAILDGDLKRLTPRDVPVKRDFVRPLDGNTSRFFDAYDAYRADKAEFKERADWTAEEKRDFAKAHPWVKKSDNDISKIVDRKNKTTPRTGYAGMGISQLRRLTQGYVLRKDGSYVQPKRAVTEEEKAAAQKVLLRKQALVIEKMGR